MRRIVIPLTLIISLTLIFTFTSCKKRDLDFEQNKAELTMKIYQVLKKADKELEQLRQAAEIAGDSVAVEDSLQIAELVELKKSLSAKLYDIETVAKNDWAQFKDDTELIINKVETGMEHIKPGGD